MLFEGAFQVADVYVNGIHLGQHRGGYTRFIFDASSVVNFGGDNVLAVKVGNKDCADCLPDGNTRLFKGYGGLYRKAWIVKTSPYQVDTTDYASSGVYVTPSKVSAGSADISIKTMLRNSTGATKTFTVKNFLTDTNENDVLLLQRDVVVAANSSTSVTQTGTISNPHLWSGKSPYLYNVHANVWVDGVQADSVDEKIGFRFYQLTSSDFTLNGVSDKLRGVSKHQESEHNATAVSDAELIQDWDNISDLGANYVRLPHYPHAKLEYDQADQRGIMVWAENGQTNGTSTSQATANGSNITREMVYQNWNHPSIIFWSAGNESDGVPAVSQYALDIKNADASRPVVYASDGQTPSNVDFIWHNTYPGWYGGSLYDFTTTSLHWISESGAGMSLSTHTDDYFSTARTVDSYEPEEYGMLNNEVKVQALFVTKASNIPAFSNWAFRDFGDVKYKNHINAKGLLTFGNYKKDAYYLFKSFMRPDTPVVHVAGAHFWLRHTAGNIKVYSNSPSITLTVNGSNKGSKTNGAYTQPNGLVVNYTFYWTSVLQTGKNTVVAVDGNGNTDSATLYYEGSGTAAPADSSALVKNVASSNASNPAYYIDTSIRDQWPFYHSFDGHGDNSFDAVPSIVAGAGWIATRRQSDSSLTSNLSFTLAANTDVYLMFTKQSSLPAWISAAGFVDTGVTGKWRNNDVKLVDYQLYKVSCSAGKNVSLGSSAIDFVVLVKPGAGGNCTSGGASAGVTYEAEAATLSGAVVASNQAGYTGSGFADYINASNDYVEWTVNVANAGTHALDFRYANGGSANRPLSVSVNATVVNASVAFNPTGTFHTWATTTLNVTLPAGVVKIRATATGASGPNIDSLTVR